MNKKNIETIYSLSPAQQGMLYDTARAPASGIYIEQLTCTLTGKLDLAAFERAWQCVIDRHAILRTSFVWETSAEPLQVVLRQVKIPFAIHDWRHLTPEEQEQRLEAYLDEDRKNGFKLARAPLLRVMLFHKAAYTYQMIWTHHHILMDGWCRHLVLQEVLTFYQAFCRDQEVHLGESRPYRDYITWVKKQDISLAERFWRAALEGFQTPTPPGKIGEQVSLTEEASYSSCARGVSASLTSDLQALAGRHYLTVNTLLQGAWALLLSRYSGNDDVLFGVTVSGRPAEISGIEKMIGLCINTLPVRVRLAEEQNLWDWLADIQLYNLEMRQYEYSSPGQIHQWSSVPGGLLLYDTLLVVENYPLDLSMLTSSDLNIAFSNIRSLGAQTKFALTLMVTIGAELELICVYDPTRFARQAVDQILEHFQMLLEQMVAEPAPTPALLRDLIPVEQIPVVQLPRQKPATEIIAPRNPDEATLVKIWTEMLGLGMIGIYDNFFELGGHSLLATQVISRVKSTCKVDLTLRDLFEAPTVAALAERISARQGTSQSLTLPPIAPASRRRHLPLSFSQQRLWFLHELMPQNSSYNISRPWRFQGALNVPVLLRCLQEILARHEILRTTFATREGQPVQVISATAQFNLPVVDLRGLAASRREETALCLITDEARRPFNLTQGPLLRVTLLHMNDEAYIFLLVIHHIIFDAWSEGIFIHELVTLYEALSLGRSSPLSALPVQYADFALCQRSWLEGEALEALAAYWRKQLANAADLQLPTDYPYPAMRNFHGTSYSFALPARLSENLLHLSRQEGVTLFMLLLAAFQVLLYRHTGQEDIVVGTDVANRTRNETEVLLGFFVNLLVLRTDLGGKPRFREFLQRVREVVLDAYVHQELPFEKLVEILQLKRNKNYTPLVRSILVFQNIPVTSFTIPGLNVSSMQIEMNTTNFELATFLWNGPQGLMGWVNYSSDLFRHDTIVSLVKRFDVLLHDIVAHLDAPIDTLEIFTPEEKEQRSRQEAQRHEVRRHKLKVARRNEIDLTQTLVKRQGR